MLMKLEGFKRLDFKTDDGNVRGDQLFTTFDDEGVVGKMTDKIFVKDGMELPALTPGMTLDIEFNRKGRVVAVKAAPATPAKS